MITQLSWAGIRKLLACPAQYDYAYVGTRVGYPLEVRVPLPRLSLGAAWGAGMQAYHAYGRDVGLAVLDESLRDIEGVLSLVEDGAAMVENLRKAYREYLLVAPPLGVFPESIEMRFTRRIPGTRVTFHGYLDGIYEKHGQRYVVDFKYRASDRFMSEDEAARAWQVRLAAWAIQTPGTTSVAFHEAYARPVKPLRLNADGRPSKVQTCAIEDYVSWYASRQMEAPPDVVQKLVERGGAVSYKLTEVNTYDYEAEHAECESFLRGCVGLLTLFRIPAYMPPRAISQFNCRGCDFLPICDHPLDDPDLLSLTYRDKTSLDEAPPHHSTETRNLIHRIAQEAGAHAVRN